MSAKHHPGPYTVVKDGLMYQLHRETTSAERAEFVIGADRPMSPLGVDRFGFACVVEEGDAHLFAASPALFDALLAMEDEVTARGLNGFAQHLGKARAALAKARGRA